jgi:D-alanine-D-alanine ligase
VRDIGRALTAKHHTVVRVPVGHDLAWLGLLRGVDVVFNLCEGVEGESHWEYKVRGAIELARIPCTGGNTWMMTVCHRKPLLNAILQADGIPVPRWEVPAGGVASADFPLPAIVKPAEEDASVGIHQTSVVATREELDERVRRAIEDHGSVFVQEYLRGREFNVAIVGNVVLPLSEIDFSRMPADKWPIVSFAAKWTAGSDEDRGTQPVCPAKIGRRLANRITETALAAWRAVDGHGYGRVDLRLDDTGRPWVLEVNPNPDISRDAGLVRMAKAHGWTYPRLIGEIVRLAREEAAAPRLRRVDLPPAETGRDSTERQFA